jgi:hypothetical protein
LRFIGSPFLLVHVPGADRPDPIARLAAPEGEGHQHQAVPVALPDGEEARLDLGVRQVGLI